MFPRRSRTERVPDPTVLAKNATGALAGAAAATPPARSPAPVAGNLGRHR
jgi:hypothetical protein